MTNKEKQYARDWYKANKERLKGLKALYYQKNKEQIKQKTKEYVKSIPVEERRAKRRAYKLKFHYSITQEQFFEMAKRQEHRCYICKDIPKQLVVDHCHKTNTVRGLLCQGCNKGLGSFKDRPQDLEEAASYLRKFA